MGRVSFFAILAILSAPMVTSGQQDLVKVDRNFGPSPVSITEQFPFRLTDRQHRIWFSQKVHLSAGSVTVRLLDPAGETLHQYPDSRVPDEGVTIATTGPGAYVLELVADGAVGAYEAKVTPIFAPFAFRPLLVSGPLMALAAAASVGIWRRRSGAAWRWFGVGAAVWTAGVIVKIVVGVTLSPPLFPFLKASLPHAQYLAIAGLYLGLATGVFEIGATLAAGLIWRQLARDASRSVAIGVGAGAFEALLLAAAGLAMVIALVASAAPQATAAESSALMMINPVAWLVGPVERVIVIFCHTASRAMTLLSVATGRWRYFWIGFLLMTLLDWVAGAYIMSGELPYLSVWWVELSLAPFGLVSIPLILWCVRRWPSDGEEAPAAVN